MREVDVWRLRIEAGDDARALVRGRRPRVRLLG